MSLVYGHTGNEVLDINVTMATALHYKENIFINVCYQLSFLEFRVLKHFKKFVIVCLALKVRTPPLM